MSFQRHDNAYLYATWFCNCVEDDYCFPEHDNASKGQCLLVFVTCILHNFVIVQSQENLIA